jgi:hypothetical protein
MRCESTAKRRFISIFIRLPDVSGFLGLLVSGEVGFGFIAQVFQDQAGQSMSLGDIVGEIDIQGVGLANSLA